MGLIIFDTTEERIKLLENNLEYNQTIYVKAQSIMGKKERKKKKKILKGLTVFAGQFSCTYNWSPRRTGSWEKSNI